MTFTVKASNLRDCWNAARERLLQEITSKEIALRWLRVDYVDNVQQLPWREFESLLHSTKRNYFRYGVSLDRQFNAAFLETELNANAMLYGGNEIAFAVVNRGNFTKYMKQRNLGRFPKDEPQFIYLFTTKGYFVSTDDLVCRKTEGFGRDASRRIVDELSSCVVKDLIESSSRYLASQVCENGRFIYGWHPCFDREIASYNSLRHASTLYSMVEAWGVTRGEALKSAIDRALKYLTEELIKVFDDDDRNLAFVVDVGDEIKLGANAVSLLALVQYTETTNDRQYLPLMNKLAQGIICMQDRDTGKFTHVISHPDLNVKDPFRIIYYDGEAVFGLMRLYGITRDSQLLETVERAFDYFIAANHWKAHDHWLSYAANELTLYRPEQKYFDFGIKNVAGHLDFVKNRITTYPTLLELMMAAQKMISRLKNSKNMSHLIGELDVDEFYNALEIRASYLLNGYFWPEMAMFFQNPGRIVGSFFIRHHAFRIRIDDVEHYLSGFCAYLKYLRACSNKK